ncbi:hypothetical protein FGO68_gene2044 [Halteria grandinella]|uniref:Uncharacterized protein n=1 Tax=Halteria grandinella TaxID=5974 RepID=A0A8J8NM22_HALGN|nr:hypothetical protein FGO68_gene2044 [Halteria grandinella]
MRLRENIYSSELLKTYAKKYLVTQRMGKSNSIMTFQSGQQLLQLLPMLNTSDSLLAFYHSNVVQLAKDTQLRTFRVEFNTQKLRDDFESKYIPLMNMHVNQATSLQAMASDLQTIHKNLIKTNSELQVRVKQETDQAANKVINEFEKFREGMKEDYAFIDELRKENEDMKKQLAEIDEANAKLKEQEEAEESKLGAIEDDPFSEFASIVEAVNKLAENFNELSLGAEEFLGEDIDQEKINKKPKKKGFIKVKKNPGKNSENPEQIKILPCSSKQSLIKMLKKEKELEGQLKEYQKQFETLTQNHSKLKQVTSFFLQELKRLDENKSSIQFQIQRAQRASKQREREIKSLELEKSEVEQEKEKLKNDCTKFQQKLKLLSQ